MSAHPLPRLPHSDEHRALRHLVTNELSEHEARAVAVAGRAQPANAAGWEALTRALHERTPRTGTVLITGPTPLAEMILEVVEPIAGEVCVWDGRTPVAAPDFLCAALPWRLEAISELPGFPSPLRGQRPVILPLAFSEQRVMVGPVVGLGGPCLRCVQPAFEGTGGLPDVATTPALFAFAAGAAGLFVRAHCARSDTATALSMTFDVTTPRVEHRLWSCTAECRTAA